MQHPDFARFLARYVLTQAGKYPNPHDEYPYHVGHIPDVVNRVVDEIILYEGITKAIPQVRARYTTTLCALLTDVHFLDYRKAATLGVLFQSHLLVAAIYLNSLALVRNLLTSNESLERVRSTLWGCPLQAAAYIGDVTLMRRLLQRRASWSTSGRRLEGRTLLDEIVRAPNASEIATVIVGMKAPSPFMGRNIPWREHGEALCLAIELGKFDVAMMLLKADLSHHNDGPDKFRITYNALMMAAEKGRADVVHGIVAFATFEYDMLVEKACKEGHEALLRILVERRVALGEKTRWLWYTCMTKSARAGHVACVRTLLNMGVVPGYALHGAISLKFLAETSAFPQSTEVLRFLFESGTMDIDPLRQDGFNAGYSLVHCIVGAAQRGNTGFLEVMASQGISLGDKRYYDAADCALPIIAAKAFRQADTVKALLEMGVADADPLESRFAPQFLSGEYPCDPPPFLGINDSGHREADGRLVGRRPARARELKQIRHAGVVSNALRESN